MTGITRRVHAYLGWCPMAHGTMRTKGVAGAGADQVTELISPGPYAGGRTPYLAGALVLAIALAIALMIIMYSGNAWWFYALIFLGMGIEGTLLHRVVQQRRSEGS
ncbi:MAG TPA: hypothetical protein HA272_07725 [Methanoregula sp.]|nr:hypothetical protein [Methanoregula sp.]